MSVPSPDPRTSAGTRLSQTHSPTAESGPAPDPGPGSSPVPGPSSHAGAGPSAFPDQQTSAPLLDLTVASPGGPAVGAPSPSGASPPAAADGAEGGERMDTDGDSGSGASGGAPDEADEAPGADSDIEILPADDAEPAPPRAAAGPAARRSLGASSVWRDTDFQEPGRGQVATDRGRDDVVEAATAAAPPPADGVITADAGAAEEHKTPVKAEGGGKRLRHGFWRHIVQCGIVTVSYR